MQVKKVQYLKGVGPKRAMDISRLGITTVSDLLYYLPRRYEDRSEISAIGDVKPDGVYTVKGRVKRRGVWKSKKGMLIYEMVVTDKTGEIHAVWYNQPYLKKHFKGAADIILYGKAEKLRYLQMTHPDYEVLNEEEGAFDTPHMGRIVPMYPLTKDVTQRYLRALIYRSIESDLNSLKEILPTALRAKNRLTDINFALKNIHFPHNFESLKMARRRIVFEEFFVLETALALIRKNERSQREGMEHKVGKGTLESFENMLSFKLTKEQLTAIKSIEDDMRSSKPMNRLLQGEVGSGKTVVAMYALLLTIKNGFQGAVMVPTETLAQQHYLTMSEFFMQSGINVRLLTGSTGKDIKEEVGRGLMDGKIDIIVGTHSLIQERVSFDKVGLIVVDEQHKFGVSQRALFRNKGVRSDVLIMTATPIPRTLAFTVYGDLDISEIHELPGGRAPISTYWVEEDRKEKVYKFIRGEISEGRQAYVVCPRIEEGEENSLKSAKAMREYLQKDVFPDLNVSLIHGRMKGSEKDQVMRDFNSNKINVLVATVLIEVGIDVPNATVMVIENADRFGLAQLHQLRGRIGRGEHKSYCILLSDPKNENAQKRLEAFEKAEDGFELAEEDLAIRGPGQMLGTRQHGLPEIRFGDMIADKEIIELARKQAFDLVEDDPGLKDERNRNLRDAVLERYKGKLGFFKVG